MCNWVNEDWKPYLVVRMNQPRWGEIMVEKRATTKSAPLFRAPAMKQEEREKAMRKER